MAITCLGCNRIMHTDCVREHGTTIPGSHVLFADPAMREFVAEERLAGEDIAFCLRCYDDVKDRIVRAHRDAGRDDEAARFLEVLEGSDEDEEGDCRYCRLCNRMARYGRSRYYSKKMKRTK